MDQLAPFIRHLQEQDYADGTIRSYAGNLKAFVKWFKRATGQEMSAEKVAPLDVRDYKKYLLVERRLAPGTVNAALTTIRTFFAWAVEAGTARGDPSAGIRYIELQELAPRWLSRKEQRDLVRELEIAVLSARTQKKRWRALRDQAMVSVMLHAGLRISEVSNARLEDLTLGYRSGKLTVRGKGSKYRSVPLNATARKALRAWLEERPTPDCPFLFVNGRNDRIGQKCIWECVGKYSRRAGIEMTPHSLRHTCAKNLVDREVPLHYVAAILGHKNVNTTARYTLPSQMDLEHAIEQIAWEG